MAIKLTVKQLLRDINVALEKGYITDESAVLWIDSVGNMFEANIVLASHCEPILSLSSMTEEAAMERYTAHKE